MGNNIYFILFSYFKLMDSTGSTTSKSDKRENSIPKDHIKFLPSIAE